MDEVALVAIATVLAAPGGMPERRCVVADGAQVFAFRGQHAETIYPTPSCLVVRHHWNQVGWAMAAMKVCAQRS